MQLQPAKNTAPELSLRRALTRLGARYRLHQPLLGDRRRKVDICFPGARVAVEVRGCFWHSCSEHGVKPRANAAWWDTKLARTRQRDQDTERRLRDAGWLLVVVWEHDDMEEAARQVAAVVRTRRPGAFGRAMGT